MNMSNTWESAFLEKILAGIDMAAFDPKDTEKFYLREMRELRNRAEAVINTHYEGQGYMPVDLMVDIINQIKPVAGQRVAVFDRISALMMKMVGCDVTLFDKGAGFVNSGMKFDIVIGNPPFSKYAKNSVKAIPLYNSFFKIATSLSDRVAMIMNCSWGATDKKLVEHNQLISSHATNITYCTEHFNVRGEQWYIIWDKIKQPSASAIKSEEYCLPERQRLNFIRGNNKFGMTNSNWPGTYQDKKSKNSVSVINRFNSRGVEYTWIEPQEVTSKLTKVKSPWFVVVPERADHPDGGWKYIQKIKNTGQQWTTNIYVFPVANEAEADLAISWLTSDEFRAIHKNTGSLNSISKNKKLPSWV